MVEKYGLALSDSQKQLFTAWNRQFAPDNWEKEWDVRVARSKGFQTPIFHNTTGKNSMDDFSTIIQQIIIWAIPVIFAVTVHERRAWLGGK